MSAPRKALPDSSDLMWTVWQVRHSPTPGWIPAPSAEEETYRPWHLPQSAEGDLPVIPGLCTGWQELHGGGAEPLFADTVFQE